MKTKHVLAIGEALIDAVSTDFVNDLSMASQLELKPGGSPANFCRFLHQLGTSSQLVATVGKDGFADIILRDLKQKHIDTSLIKISPIHTTSLIAVGKSKGTPDFIPYRDADMQIGRIDPAWYTKADLIHTTAFALSKEPAQTTILTALQRARQAGIQLSVDWNYSEKIWGPDNNSSLIFKAVLSFKPILKFSLDDASRFLGTEQTIESAKEYLSNFPATVACLTCGSEGVWFKTAEQDWQHQGAPPVEVKDSTGAGDSFWAGFINAWLRELPIEEAIDQALHTAARRLRGELS
ncbi:carbohydrate kinase family protein [Flavihumibacter sp. UBA7668]|uniref:carbohydrate kinase family protein n=1 Tax=Flavihumibacter sp. UBA7668 TaxID=1946542 RepID=UPI0025C62CE7|nr:carbohydrate kinase family protein [Flavihumibacter sp. UBA7668]